MPAALPFALFDDNLPGGRHLWLDAPLAKLVCTDAAEVEQVFARIDAARRDGHWVALAASYELGYALEPRLRRLAPQDGRPLLTAWICKQGEWLAQDDSLARLDAGLAAADQHQRLAGVAGLERAMSAADYSAALAEIDRLIAAGDCYQVNFTWPLTGCAYGAPLAMYRRLMGVQPVRHGGFIADDEGAILSRSPELFVERRGARLTCRPMNGTAPRAAAPETLARSVKDRAENVMIVDLIRNDLGRLAPAGGVRVESLCAVEPFPTVWQMTSTVVAEPVTAGLLEIFRALFPCGSVTGAPKIRAMEIIRSLESGARGLYCGALGWLAPDGDFSLNVPIRTLSLAPDGRFSLHLGSGVVADSDAAAEWAECLLKGRFLTGLPPPFGLIETLRCEAGAAPPYPLLDAHLRRLAASAAHFGHPCAIETVRTRLLEHAATLSPGRHRVRLELSPDGRLDISGGPLAATSGAIADVAIAPRRVHSADPLLRHKTTARAVYDEASRHAAAHGLFDLIFLNEHGELAEGARSTVFLARGDGPLRTPPLAAGVLDGVLRRTLIDAGQAVEARITLDELRAAERLFVGNALRGLIEARLVPLPPH